MYKTLIAILIIILMCSMASAEQVKDWPHEQRNVMPDYIEGVMYDFEEGSNCGTFNNQYPNVTTFLTVEGCNVPIGYGLCYPSYNTVGGSMCGTTRCYMNIWPYDNRQDWIIVVNGRSAFSPKTCCESDPLICWTGECYPGPCAEVEFKEGIRYVSFLASTDGTLRVILRDSNDNILKYEQIYSNTDRIHPEPSNFTQFYFNSQDTDIASMELTGAFNGWIMDDLIVGYGYGTIPPEPEPTPTPTPEPTPPEEASYAWAAERLKLLIGAPHNPNGFGYMFQTGTFYSADDIVNNPLVVNWDNENKEWTTGAGINNEAAIIWAFNVDENLINNAMINDMAKKDFKVLVEYGDQKPGDVAFIEYDTGDTSESAIGYDEIIVFIEPQVDSNTGMVEDCIRVSEEGGVHYSDSNFLHDLYGTTIGPEITSLFTVKSMPKEPKGNKKSPYPNIPGKFI